jgi:hypothetical protein
VDNDLIELGGGGGGSLKIYRHSPRLCPELQALLQRPLAVGDRVRSMRLTHGELALFTAVLLTSGKFVVFCCCFLRSPLPVTSFPGFFVSALLS